MHETSLDALITRSGLARHEAERRLLAGKQPTGRLIAPDGVAALVAFLCREEGGTSPVRSLTIDGGWSAT